MRLLAPACALCALTATQAMATAFQLREGSATAIGSALAGRTASNRDVSFSLYNPAALSGVKGLELSSGISLIFASGDATAQPPFNNPLGLATTDDPNQNAIIPSFAAGWRVAPDLVIGVAIDSPFGLASEYSDGFIGAFDAVRSELLTLTVTPMIAWETVPGFTIGAGVSLQYADAKLENRGPNGVQDISGDGFDVGFVIGAQFEPVDGTRLGFAYTTGYKHKLSGNYSDNFFPAVFAGAAVDASFELPPSVSLGLIQDITADFRVMGEAEWTGWSTFDNIVFTSTGRPTVTDVQNYEDSFLFSIGAEYDATDALTLRAGVAYDSTPTRDAFRTARVPDGDRLWFAAGASYELTEKIGIDAAYLYLTIDGSSVDLDRAPGNAPNSVRVNYDNGAVHLLTMNLRYAF